MAAIRPDPGVLEGRYIRLRPLERTDLAMLFEAIGHPLVFAGGFGGGPAGYRDTLEGFIEWADSYFSWTKGNVYAVIIAGGPHDETLVGTTSLTDFEPEHEHAHIGWTAFDPRVWGTQVNVESKRLLLGLAFDHGFGRVKLQADVLNERSRKAIARIGATFEGVTRRDRRRADGSWRHSATFSVVVEEWPEVRAALDATLERFGGRPVLYRSVGGADVDA